MKISQTKIIYDLLLDGEPHSTYEMVNLIKTGRRAGKDQRTHKGDTETAWNCN